MTSTRTDTYDLALLAGGTTRAVDTAVVALLARGRLEVDGGGLLIASGTVPVHPVESAVHGAVGTGSRCSADAVRARAEDDPRVLAAADRLAAEGLLRPTPWARLLGRSPARVPTAAGRRLLAEARRQPLLADDVRVALGGVAAMTDPGRRDLVFGAGPGRTRTRSGRPRAGGWAGGRASGSSSVAWGGGDGGSWGGDGGGCGGGDGGGGGGC